MAQKRIDRQQAFRTNGAAAYDVHAYETALPKRKPTQLPEERQAPGRVRQKVVRARLPVMPGVVLGFLAISVMVALVIFTQADLYEATSQASALTTQLAEVAHDNEMLQTEYESKIDMDAIEKRAMELGMVQPSANQTVYLDLTGTDRGEVLQQDSGSDTSFFQKLVDGVARLVAYLQ
ncbi:hypothetical protein ACTQ33_09815 [Candidatus Avoscillospira sp. LCP25S3_F1]|uniref:hypothetical protein n=1 Tax=Candidatus Avoscillospira sp. LCP25S3_F1 TaxID=3438825 RepID=UPI003F912E8D